MCRWFRLDADFFRPDRTGGDTMVVPRLLVEFELTRHLPGFDQHRASRWEKDRAFEYLRAMKHAEANAAPARQTDDKPRKKFSFPEPPRRPE